MSSTSGDDREIEVELTPNGEVREVKPDSPQALEADIEAQREQLAETIDALTAKLDVKARAKDTAADVKDRATTDAGKPRPELMAAAGAVLVTVVAVWWWRRRR